VVVLATELEKVLAGLPGDIVLHLVTAHNPALRPRGILPQRESLAVVKIDPYGATGQDAGAGAVGETAALKRTRGSRIAIASLIEKVIIECVRPINPDVVAVSGDTDKASRHHLRRGEEIDPKILRLLIDVAAKNTVTLAKLVVHASGCLVVIEWRCDGAPCCCELDGLPQHVHGGGCSKGEIADGTACRTNGGQRADRGIIRKRLLQLTDSVRSRGKEGCG
jgi:hypothetical protein